ncbi:hypothetical protein BRYFOR_09123 [Marvinbryantia formatexigens DSM 14469]|uniref:Uncharacterized protein n=2 Tax=Marvinbryantia TaxID=248744 RepID=C6LKD6_9FIRM|nr:hypothetical protein BRYFOR_09123 [Marvinbryantia formatexigens DSM 14469]
MEKQVVFPGMSQEVWYGDISELVLYISELILHTSAERTGFTYRNRGTTLLHNRGFCHRHHNIPVRRKNIMKNLKKMAALSLVAALGMTAGSTALATDTSPKTLTGEGSATIGVTGTYDGSTAEPGKVYRIDIEWGSMEFTYEANVTKTWNTTTHDYVESSGNGVWAAAAEGVSNKITVTNHSNAAVSAGLSFTGTPAVITGEFKEGADTVTGLRLASAEDTKAAVAKSALFNITGGTLDASAEAGTAIGTITVTITE